MKHDESMETAFREYLLGQLSESEEKRFEERLMDDDGLFRRAEALIDCIEDDLVEDYLRGELNESEQRAFELRFLGSPKIREKLILVQALLQKGSTQKVITSPSKRVAESGKVVPFKRWRSLILQPLPALAASLMLIVLGGGFWSATRIWRLEDRLAEMQTRQHLLISAQDRLETQLGEERRLSQQLTSELDSATARSARLEESIASLGRRTIPAVASFLLTPGLSRGSGRAASVQLSEAHQTLELKLDLGLDDYPAYRAALCDAGGEEILVYSRLHSTQAGDGVLVVLQIPSDLIQPGPYLVKLSGITAAGSLEQLELYHFRFERE